MNRPIAVMLLAFLAACASPSPMPAIVTSDGGLSTVDVLLLGEQHDAPDHQDMHRRVVETLAARRRLAAVALEMAEQGASTAALPAGADETAVRAALRWNESGWPWQAYRDAVMAAVRSGVPVIGANLPRSQMRAAMADSTLDGLLPAPALQAQQQAIRRGHCGLLPESQIAPMARIQVGRDRAMAQTLAQAAAPGKVVLLLAGRGHVDPALGVPQHLPALLRVHSAPLPERPPQKDYCEELRRRMKPQTPQ
jgi:uncharacterized iron-regulated protein